MNIDQLNRLSEADAITVFGQCCGASAWAERMAFARPFEDLGEVLETAGNIWEECDVDDYEEAFNKLPLIGVEGHLDPSRPVGNAWNDLGAKWAAAELKALEGAAPDVRAQLAAANRLHEEKFGHRFVVSATGKSAQELCAMLEERMKLDPEEEILVAASEQLKILRLRLKKLLA